MIIGVMGANRSDRGEVYELLPTSNTHGYKDGDKLIIRCVYRSDAGGQQMGPIVETRTGSLWRLGKRISEYGPNAIVLEGQIILNEQDTTGVLIVPTERCGDYNKIPSEQRWSQCVDLADIIGKRTGIKPNYELIPDPRKFRITIEEIS